MSSTDGSSMTSQIEAFRQSIAKKKKRTSDTDKAPPAKKSKVDSELDFISSPQVPIHVGKDGKLIYVHFKLIEPFFPADENDRDHEYTSGIEVTPWASAATTCKHEKCLRAFEYSFKAVKIFVEWIYLSKTLKVQDFRSSTNLSDLVEAIELAEEVDDDDLDFYSWLFDVLREGDVEVNWDLIKKLYEEDSLSLDVSRVIISRFILEVQAKKQNSTWASLFDNQTFSDLFRVKLGRTDGMPSWKQEFLSDIWSAIEDPPNDLKSMARSMSAARG